MQSYLARKSLDSQLQRLGALSSNESISMFTEDFEIFKTSMNCVTFVVRDGNGAVRVWCGVDFELCRVVRF